MQQLDLFGAQRLPKKPWCTDDKEAGLQVKPLARALAKRYLQFNPPHAVFWIVLDVDAPIALADTEKPSEQMLAILDGQIPTPNFMVVNRENGHAHAFFALETAVAKGEHASQKALRYVAAIEAALIRTMRPGIGATTGAGPAAFALAPDRSLIARVRSSSASTSNRWPSSQSV